MEEYVGPAVRRRLHVHLELEVLEQVVRDRPLVVQERLRPTSHDRSVAHPKVAGRIARWRRPTGVRRLSHGPAFERLPVEERLPRGPSCLLVPEWNWFPGRCE